jgi:hypothetical protein
MRAFTSTRTNDGRIDWAEIEIPFEISDCGSLNGGVAQVFIADPARQPPLAVLLASEDSGIRVNGALCLAVTVLSDRDEIRAADGRIFLFAAYAGAPRSGVATETPAIACARCHRAIAAGERWVGCNACTARYHADPPLQPDATRGGANCRDYDSRCAGCQRTWTSMHWTPADLGWDGYDD